MKFYAKSKPELFQSQYHLIHLCSFGIYYMFLHYMVKYMLMFRSRVLSRLYNRNYLNTMYQNGKKHFILINDAIFFCIICIYIVFSYSFACRSSCSRASERVGVDATGGCNAILAACTSWGSTLARIRGTCIWRISITPNTTTKTLAYPKTRKRA